MVRTSLASVLRHLSLASAGASAPDLDDARLLERFCTLGEEAAFTLLVVRHGPMVLGVCRRLLGDSPDAEDAFQATFIVLLRRASRVRRASALASWLHGVAWRVATRARAQRANSAPLQETPARREGPSEESARREAIAMLDEEIGRLPARYRIPVVLCSLRGLSYEEASRELGWPKSTVAFRLDRARKTLRRRLQGRGLASAAALAVVAGASRASVPAGLTLEAVRLAIQGRSRAAPSVPALTLADGMTGGLVRIRWVAVWLAACAAVGLAGLGWIGSAKELTEGKRPAVPLPSMSPRLTDAEGIPLPAGAITRVGSSRLRHGQQIANVTYSPDGRLIASSGCGWLRVWDARTGKLVHHIECPDRKEVLKRGYARDGLFNADSKTVMALHGKTCRWFDVATGKEVRRCEIAILSEDQYYTVGLTPHAETIAVRDGRDLIVYDLPSGMERHRWNTTGSWEGCLRLASDCRTLAALEYVAGKAAIQLFDTRNGERVRSIDLAGPINRFCFSPDGRLLFGYSGNEMLFVWNASDGSLLHRLKFEGRSLNDVAVAPDGKAIALSANVPDVLLIDPITGKELRRLPVCSSNCLAFAPDSKKLVVANYDGGIAQLSIETGRLLDSSSAPPAGFSRLHFSKDGQRLLGWAGEYCEFNWRSGKEVFRFADPADGRSWGVALSPDGSRLARLKVSRDLTVWDTDTGQELLMLPSLGRSDWATPGFSPDGRTLYCSRWGEALRAFQVSGGKEHNPCVTEQSGQALLAISAGVHLLVTARKRSQDNGSEVSIWDVPTGREVRRIKPTSKPEYVWSVTLSPDESLIAMSGCVFGPPLEGFVTVVNSHTGREILQGSDLNGGCMRAVAFSPDGRALATGGDDGVVRLWEIASGLQRAAFTDGESPVWSVAFSPDGKYLASGSTGSTVVWNVMSGTGRPTSNESFTGEEKGRLWQALTDSDAEKAFAAMNRLLTRPGRSVELLSDRLQPATPIAKERMRGLLRDLDAADFSIRERAAADLKRIADVAEEPLRTALVGEVSAEVRKRLAELLDFGEAAIPDRLRQVRVVEVLERIGTPEALNVLKKLAAGAPGARLTREAKASLQRRGQK